MHRPALASARVLAFACAAIALGGCGGDGDGEAPAGDVRPPEGGILDFALAGEPAQLDPLLADDRSSQVVTRQVHEPLVESLSGPFGDLRELPGLAKSWGSSGETIWRFRLRERVRFGDGTPFNASAVLANSDRWLTTPAGRALLPGLAAVDAPHPDIVRFILSRPDADFPALLSQARLGLVSPRVLRAARPVQGVQVAGGGSGTGPFEFREQGDATTVLARNTGWWGTRIRLGPALDQLVFTAEPDPATRVALLAEGRVEVADELDGPAAREVRADPLLAVESDGSGPVLGIERSVRGIDDERGVPLLSGAWLTTVGAGE